MSPAEITKMMKALDTAKYGHEQMFKNSYESMMHTIRSRNYNYSEYTKFLNEFNKAISENKKSNIVFYEFMMGLYNSRVESDTSLLNHYRKFYPKCYAIALRNSNKKGN